MSDTKTVMTDWSGIPVHVGDTILFIRTIVPRILPHVDYLDPETKKGFRATVIPVLPQRWGWEVTWESEITEVDGIPHINAPVPNHIKGGNNGVLVPVHLFWDMYCDQRHFTGNTFAIKGISDKHEKYFRNFFRRAVMNKN